MLSTKISSTRHRRSIVLPRQAGCPVVWKDESNQTVATGVTDPNLNDSLYPVADRTYDLTTGNLNRIFAPKCALDLSGNQLERALRNMPSSVTSA